MMTRINTSVLSRLPWWLLFATLLAILFAWQMVAQDSYRLILLALTKGVGVTLFVSLTAFTLATLLGLGLALLRVAKSRWLREIATFYIEIVRGVPMLVLLFYIAFVGAPQLIMLANWVCSLPIQLDWMTAFTVRDFDFTARAIVALMIGYSAFIAEIFRAGIEAVEKGQVEAAQALGLNRWQAFRLVIWPQALRTILPPLGNDFVAMIKDSALVSALGVQDITQLGKVYSSSTFLFFETYNIVAFLYLVMTIILSLGVKWLEFSMKEKRLG
ncbi:amino acid ABC transporter permease [Reinekea sp.]|uniref:amino acid ABC transporter permease n=1 Tax=Reinekea sp. TaxID=1970455 RepID=UPI002A800CFD|nr:amino acid ABC transporter permease [Reinekea sp.]